MTGIELLEAWMQQAGLDDSAKDDSGRVCAFTFNDIFPVTLEAPAYCDDLFIIIEMTSIGTSEIRRKRLETAMKLNAYALETRGAALGWDTIGERIVLSHRATAENTTAEMLDNMVANLLDVAEQLLPELEMKKEAEAQQKLDAGFDKMFQPVTP
ncbi:hypothetical protein GZ77_16930 [Endozoicomonas montiporae]|uniref:Uncharacterized protein n=2 Tax=Endozoicomonas montiporae TaxID=1027273 RepID=A0A081N656_9GAMM|nr:CesT family type III secretion system chaperone [Endozoicomonas montiporae]AMO57148.1 hypothetical protein EZMO1_3142 [Endozoicomonas montiporae CL-33]KEQ13929.1 hypothetical protein GZ77_16930 [Endozoicomonas montiporae]